MKVEVINTGTELLLGNTINTHLGFLGRELFKLGLRIERQVAVPDGDAIGTTLKETFGRGEIVIVTGGLGPTTDDITREITAELLGLPLHIDQSVVEAIKERFARRNMIVRERNLRQAMVPLGATVLPNPNGTAPGLYIPPVPLPGLPGGAQSPHLFLLPGPPRELKPMFTDHVVGILQNIVPARERHVCCTVRLTGIGESEAEARVGEQLLAIAGLELGYCARPGEVEIRLIGNEATVNKGESVVLAALKEHVVSIDDHSLAETLVSEMTRDGKTLAIAESCTGGSIANRITNVPGSSAVLIAGMVTYANEAKTALLGVQSALIAKYGAVSEPVAAAMAEGALKATGASFAVSATGIAGPGGGTEKKPVGLVFIGCAVRDAGVWVERLQFSGDRETFKEYASQAALDLLWRRFKA